MSGIKDRLDTNSPNFWSELMKEMYNLDGPGASDALDRADKRQEECHANTIFTVHLWLAGAFLLFLLWTGLRWWLG